MVKQKTIDEFLGLRSFAVVGVSRSGKKFGNTVYRTLRESGRSVFPVNRYCDHIDGDRCYPNLDLLPEPVDAIVLVVPPNETERMVKRAAELGIRYVWMQQGSESRKAIEYCEQYGLNAISGLCILMFVEPVLSFHKFHRWALKVLHKLPR
jgi:predicted CoA-binding protein